MTFQWRITSNFKKAFIGLVFLFLTSCILFINNVSAEAPPAAYVQSVDVKNLYTPADQSTKLHQALWFDGPLAAVKNSTSWDWYHAEGWIQQKFTGPLQDPAETFLYNHDYVNDDPNYFTMSGYSGSPWIQSIYKDPSSGHLLGFVHTENVNGGYGRVGLAYSKNNGNTWKYLGYIIAPHHDWNGYSQMLSGGPYIIVGDYFYTYFNEAKTSGSSEQLPLSVARASVSDVIQAAENDTVTVWHKYYNGSWDELGLGGNSTPIFYPGGTASLGIGWQMSYNTYLGQYIYTYCDSVGLNLSTSYDGLEWSAPVRIHKSKTGFFDSYCSIVGNGDDPYRSGQTFSVYVVQMDLSNPWALTSYYDRCEITLGEAHAAASGHTDEFNNNTLDGAWSWVREDNTKWSLTTNAGYMSITSNDGELFGNYNSSNNVLLRNAPSGDWSICTKVDINPSISNQQAGLIVYKDDDSYIKLTRAYVGDHNGNVINYAKEIAGSYGDDGYPGCNATTVFLKITKTGTTYTLYYNLDGGSIWTQVKQYTDINFAAPLKIGLICQSTPIAANFDWFDITKPQTVHTDDFTSAVPGSSWSWVREDNTKWSLTAKSGYMRITSTETELFGNNNNTTNVLLRDAPSGDWSMCTKLEMDPSVSNQQAGLIVYKDDDNYIKNVRVYASEHNGNNLNYAKETGGAYGDDGFTECSGTTVYLKITKSGTTYTLYYNLDGSTNWTQIKQYTGIDFGAAVKVGLLCQNNPVNADFDWFDLVSHTDEFTDSTLNSSWSWVREDNTKWSLTAKDGYMRITSTETELFGNYNNTTNVLLRDAPSGDWSMCTKLEMNPSVGNQQAGLIVYKDDDNYIKNVRVYASEYNGDNLNYAKEIGGAYGDDGFTACSGTTVYLKITKSGTTYTLYYNLDGSTNWTQIKQYTGVDFGTSFKIGLLCQNIPVNADFDWFDVR